MVFGKSDRRMLYQRGIRRKRRFIGRGILTLAVVVIVFLVTNKSCQSPPDVLTKHKDLVENDLSNVPAYQQLAETYYNKAVKLDEQNKGAEFFKQAIEFYQKGIVLDKENTIKGVNYYHLGMSYFKISKYLSKKNYYNEAKLAFDKAIEKGFKSPDIYIYLGHIAFKEYLGSVPLKEEKIDEAIENYNKAKDLNKKDVAAWFNLGWAYKRKGMSGKSLSAFQQASKIENLDKNLKNKIYLILANIYEEQKLLEHAKAEYEAILKLNRNSEIAHYRLGKIYRTQGNTDMALQEFKRALKINSANKEVQLELAELEGK